MDNVLRTQEAAHARLVKGSHIVVPKLFDHDSAYIFQNSDGRIVFALPYERDFTLIGTTDEDFTGDPAGVAPSHAEINYLCKVVMDYFRAVIGPADVVWSFAGVRSLYDDGSKKAKDTTRDYHLVLDEGFRRAPLLTIYGGKITTYRRLAEVALKRMADFFVTRPAWTATAPLPGGDFAYDAVDSKIAQARRTWPFLTEGHARRLVRAYGTRIDRVLGEAKAFADLGACFGADLTETEVRYLMTQEWAQEPDDILWRRTKLGLRFDAAQQAALAAFMAGSAVNAAE
jgi:glycerol-3-phosphate dehydrogenase